MDIDYKLIGQHIKNVRKRNDLTQARVAEILDVSIGYISQVERGTTKISLDLIGKMCAVFHCEITELIVGSAIRTEGYINTELTDTFSKLTSDEKKFLLKFMQLMIDNRK